MPAGELARFGGSCAGKFFPNSTPELSPSEGLKGSLAEENTPGTGKAGVLLPLGNLGVCVPLLHQMLGHVPELRLKPQAGLLKI